MSPVLVFHFGRVAGCVQPLVDFFAWWQLHGPFPVTIPPDGALRTDEIEQARLFAKGVSNARTLWETPHGRAAAIDAYPAIIHSTGAYVERILNDVRDAETLKLFSQYGALAESHGLTWGGRWHSKDYPHVEVPGWRELPFNGKSQPGA